MTSLAFHVDQLFSPVPGGIGTYVRRLVPAMTSVDRDLDVALFHARFGQGSPRPERWMRRYWAEELPFGIAKLYPRWALLGRPALPSSLASRDIVHAPSPAAVPPAGPRQRLVVTVHDLAFLVHGEVFPPKWRAMFRAGLARAARSADAVIAVSAATADDLAHRTRIPPSKVHIVPLAPSLPPSDAGVDETLARLRVPSPYVLFNGTLERRKNLVRLVRAYRQVVANGAPHALVLAGALGWRPQDLMAELAVEAPGRIVLTGRVSASELDALYRGADAFVYPSLYEGFGLPVLDAMARGLPCVVSATSSLPEVAGGAALVVDPLSVPDLAAALERVLSDADTAARMAAAGRTNAARFSWDDTARATLAVYASALAEPRRT